MNSLPSEVLSKINDYRYGDKVFWKSKFNNVVQHLIHESVFQYELCWNSESCERCQGDDLLEFGNLVRYDLCYQFYLDNYVGMVNPTCQCVVKYCKIHSEYTMLDPDVYTGPWP